MPTVIYQMIVILPSFKLNPLYDSKNMMCLLCLSLRWMMVLNSRKQATLKQQQEREREKRGGEEKDEEKEKLVDGEEDSRSKSFSTLLYEDKVHTAAAVIMLY